MFRPPGCHCEKPGVEHNDKCYTPWMISQPLNSHSCLTDFVVRKTGGAEHRHHLCGSFCPGPDSEAVRQLVKAWRRCRKAGGGDDRPLSNRKAD